MATARLLALLAVAFLISVVRDQPLPHGCYSFCSTPHGHCVSGWPYRYCTCDYGNYRGNYCQSRITTLKSGQTVDGFVWEGYWNYYFFNLNVSQKHPLPKGSSLVMTVMANHSDPVFPYAETPDLYTQFMHQPNMTDFACHSSNKTESFRGQSKQFATEKFQNRSRVCVVTDLSKLTPTSVWHMAVYGAQNNTGLYTLTATLNIP